MKNHFMNLKSWFKKRTKIYLFMFLLFSFFYSFPNTGGAGWMVPSNIAIWFGIGGFVSIALVLSNLNINYVFSNVGLFLGVLLFCLAVLGAVNTSISHSELFGYFGLFIFIWLFFIAVLQFKLDFKLLIQLLFVVVVIGVLQSIISYIQVFDNYRIFNLWFGYEPFRITGRPTGSFQQVNMLASFLSLSLISALFLLSLKPKQWLTNNKKIFLYIASFTIFSVLLLSGSRTGFLALIIPILGLLILRYKAFKNNILPLALWVLSLTLGGMFVYFILNDLSSINLLADKLSKVSSGTDSRIHLYFSGFNLFLDSPWVGYGIGGYNEALQGYYQNQSLPNGLTQSQIDRMTHPHNELLFWMLQSGVVALIVVLAFVVYYLKVLFNYNKGYAWLILILISPLIIQTQLSYPFTLSAMHLFLLLILLAFGVKDFVYIKINSSVVSGLLMMFAVFVLVVTTYAAYLSLKSIKEVFYFQSRLSLYQDDRYEGYEQNGYLLTATKHPLFSRNAINAMESMLIRAEKTHNLYDVKQYLLWASQQEQMALNIDSLKKAKSLQEKWQ